MRTGLVAGLIAAGTVLLLNFGHALGNADFIYMCAGAALLDSGRLPVTPYFPPGYSCLLWAAVKAGLPLWPGMSALYAGSILAALGTGLSAGALAQGARGFRVPPAPALLLGLLGASLPDVAEIALNPHVDALFTGCALCLLVATLHGVQRPHLGATLGAALCGAVLLTLRWHSVLIVAPCLLLLLATRRTRLAGLALLAAALVAGGWSYWGLYATYGRLDSAAPLQVAAGAVYRAHGPGGESAAAAEIFGDYAAWIEHAPPVTHRMLSNAVRTNWPLFISRKAVLAGLALWLLALLVYRRWPPQSHWLLLFVLGYPVAVGTTYFTPRASALVELAALVLGASAISLVFTQEEHELQGQRLQRRRLHFKPNPPSLRIDGAFAGGVLAFGCAAALGWNTWRVERDLRRPLLARHATEQAVYARALAAAHAEAGLLLGRIDRQPCALHLPWGLPGPCYSLLWLDDPRVSALFASVLPPVVHSSGSELDGLRAVLIWDQYAPGWLTSWESGPARAGGWNAVETGEPTARLWQRAP